MAGLRLATGSSPGSSAAPMGWWRPLRLAAIDDPARALPTDWGNQLGEYAGAWAAGSALGYVVTRNSQAAFRTGLATSSVRNLVDVVTNRNSYPIWYLAFLGLTGVGSILYVWRQGRKS